MLYCLTPSTRVGKVFFISVHIWFPWVAIFAYNTSRSGCFGLRGTLDPALVTFVMSN